MSKKSEQKEIKAAIAKKAAASKTTVEVLREIVVTPTDEIEAVDSLGDLAEKLKTHSASLASGVMETDDNNQEDYEDYEEEDEEDAEDAEYYATQKTLPGPSVVLDPETEIAKITQKIDDHQEELELRAKSKVAVKYNKLWVCLVCQLGKPLGSGEEILMEDVPYGKGCGLCGKPIPSLSPAPKSVSQTEMAIVAKVDVTKKSVSPVASKIVNGKTQKTNSVKLDPNVRAPFGSNYNSDVVKVVMSIPCIGVLGPQGAHDNCEKEFRVETPGWKNLKPQFLNWKELKERANSLGWLWRDYELLCPACLSKYPVEIISESSKVV